MQWSAKWQMSFNIDDCKVTHIESRNNNYEYYMRGKPLRTVNKESGLGITISSDLKLAENCKAACRRANTILGFIERNFVCKNTGNHPNLVQLVSRASPGICCSVLPTSLKEGHRITGESPAVRNKDDTILKGKTL